MVPSLIRITQLVLIRYKSLLGDIGFTPVELLHDVLEACTPAELQQIESATATGVSGRDLTPYTWPLWYKHCKSKEIPNITTMPTDHELPPLPCETSDLKAVNADEYLGIHPAHYRVVYQDLLRQIEERRKKTGKLFKERRLEQEVKKASRSVHLLTSRPVESTKTKKKKQVHMTKVTSAKEKMMKKLNIPIARPVNFTTVQKKSYPQKRPLPSRSSLVKAKSQPSNQMKNKTAPKPPLLYQVCQDDDMFRPVLNTSRGQ